MLERSVFARDHRSGWSPPGSRNGPGGFNGPGGDNGSRPGTNPFAPPDPEASLALRGVGVQDGLATAFVEDTAAHKSEFLHLGDSIAKGRVTGIRLLEGIDYTAGTHVQHVHIGETLKGTPAPGAPTTSPSLSSPGGNTKTNRWIHSHDDSATPAAATISPGSPEPDTSRGQGRFGPRGG